MGTELKISVENLHKPQKRTHGHPRQKTLKNIVIMQCLISPQLIHPKKQSEPQLSKITKQKN